MNMLIFNMVKHFSKRNICMFIFLMFLFYWGYSWGFIGAMIMPIPIGIICLFNYKWD